MEKIKRYIQMKYPLATSLLILSVCVNGVFAQSTSDYVKMREKAQQLMALCQYSAAYKVFNGAEDFAVSSRDKAEIARLQKLLKDSVQAAYQRGIALIQKGGTPSAYGSAIQELKKLVPVDNLYAPQVFSWLGTAYERINEPYGAIEQYAQGVNHKERFSAMRLAELLQKHKTVSRDSLVILYEYAAPENKGAYETLGDMFINSSPQRAYNYYKKAESYHGKYQMATLILTNKVSSDDNPIIILQQLSDENYSDAQFYLGLLYFHGKRLPQNTEEGLRLINAAKVNGNNDAKQWLIDRNSEIRRLKYSY